MAQMHPPSPDPDTPISERKVFEILRDGLPPQWTVLHSRRIVVPARGRKRATEGESDFLVVDPARGFLVLEVKGGKEIGSDRNGWYSVDHHDKRHDIKDPGKQVQALTHRLLDFLREKRRWPVPPDERRIGFGVVLPDFDVRMDPGPGLPREMVLDRGDLALVRPAIDRLFDAHGVPPGSLPDGTARLVIDTLHPLFRLVRSLAARIDDQEKVLLQLTAEQFHVVEAAADNPRLVVRGGAGTGKTMVAMELARLHSEEGRRTLFLCYNAPLAEHLGRRAAGFEVQTFHKKCKRLVDGAGLSQRWPADPDADFFRDSAPELMTQALDRLPDERWDAVVIDEGQDFLELWWIPIEKMLRDRSTGFLQVFWDPNQDLYGGAPTESLGLTAIRLRYNCRNTRRIGSFAASLVEDSALFRSGAPDGDAVERIEVADEHGMADAVRRVLHRIVREEKVPTDRIVLLSTVRQERSAVLRTGKVGPFGLVDAGVATTGPDQIRCSTIHRFKGLEAEVVVLCDVAPGESWSPPNLLHVGASRAKHYLVEVSYGTRAN